MVDGAAPARVRGGPRPCRATGLRLLGSYEGSGFRDERYLVERADRQVVMLTKLLYLIVRFADGRTSTDLLATRVSKAYGHRLDPDDLVQLIEDKLAPAGLVGLRAAPSAGVRRADPLLALSIRGVLLPGRVVRIIGRMFTPLFHRVIVACVLAALVILDWWLITTMDLADLFAALVDPVGVLVVLGLLLAATVFHEFGHAAGCTYGGATPGPIGVGLYLWIPAFYTNVTDAYRLNRAGRLRTDLGGIYFNAVVIVLAGAAYLSTGWPPLLALIALSHLEILQQLLPIVRFDGYYILGDLAGVPNLFGHVRPILRSFGPGRRHDPAVASLRTRTRVVVTVWVLVTVPALVVGFGMLIWNAPDYLSQVWHRTGELLAMARVLAEANQWGAAAASMLGVLVIFLPVVGVGLVLLRAIVHLVRAVRRHPQEESLSAAVPGTTDDDADITEVVLPGASAFTEQAMLLARVAPPRHGWRRGLYVVSRGRLNLGPSAAERREQAMIARIRTRVRSPRRIVVLSRKGGAGKTTTALMLGHTLAAHRGDRVVALDANPDAGSLVYRVHRESEETVTSLLAERDFVTRYTDIRSYTSQAESRLEVIASDDDPLISQALGDRDYHSAIELLTKHYSLIVVDTGTGILDSAVQGVIREADQIIVVMPPALDGARVAAATLDWLDRHGHHDLVENAVAVINAVRGTPRRLQLDEIERHFAGRCADVVRIPWDQALEAGAETTLEELRQATREAYLNLAESVAGGFSVDRWDTSSDHGNVGIHTGKGEAE